MKTLKGFKMTSALLLFMACTNLNAACDITVTSTIQAALKIAKAGQTVCVPDGTYNESGLWFANSGTTNAWITLKAINPLKAKIVGGISVNKTSYIEINGFDISSPGSGTGIYMGNCTAAPCGHHARILNNLIHDCGGNGIGATHYDYLDIENNIITRNAFTNTNSSSGISLWQLVASDALSGPHSLIKGNTCFANDNKFANATDGNGIIIDDSQNTQNGSKFGVYKASTIVESNTVYGNGGAGIHVFHSDGVTIQNNRVFLNHTRVDSSTWKGEISFVYANRNQALNNTAIAHPFNKANTPTLDVGGGTGNIWSGNIVCTNGVCK